MSGYGVIADNIIYKDKAMLGRADTGIAFLFLAKPASVQGLLGIFDYSGFMYNRSQPGSKRDFTETLPVPEEKERHKKRQRGN